MAIPRPLLPLALIGALTMAADAHAHGEDEVTITLEPDQTLRGLAETYLHEPDLWPEILRANRLESAHHLRPGQRLRIPVAAIVQLDQALRQLRELIYQATEAGAQVFATAAIAAANANHADALQARRQGTLDGAAKLAEQGIAAARLALLTSLLNREVPAEAVLESAAGTVQHRRPSDFDWSAIAIKALLVEQERLRTLSNAFALVRFRDASSLRINENAELAIRRMRRDLLTRREQVNVVLYGGDIHALLESGAGRRTIQLEVPGIETRVRSDHYWIQKDRNINRLANYDGEIEVSARGGTVVVGQNQGTLVKRNTPRAPIDLLAAPALHLPADRQMLYGTGVDFSWEENANAAVYWLEVARDREFKRLLFNETAIKGSGYYLPVAEQGLYYWRVSTVDSAGLPGPASDSRRFQLKWDNIPPYLVVNTPADGSHFSDARIRITGRTEPEAVLRLNAEPVPVADDGRFAVERTLDEGANTLLLEARDPAGNHTRMEHIVHLSTGAGLPLSFADELPRDAQMRLLVNHPQFSLEGSTLAGASIRIHEDPAGFQASGVADEQGKFHFSLPARTGVSKFVVDVEGPAGRRKRQSVEVLLDSSPPLIHLDTPPAARTASPVLALSGRIEGAAAMTHEGQAVPLSSDGRFTLEVPLRAGAQVVTLNARDLAGNQAVWQQTVVLDQTPPLLAGYRLIHADEAADGSVVVEISARDESEVIAAVPYSLQVGELIHRGIARRSPDRSCHRDRVALPPSSIGQPRLRSVILQDYLGNRQDIEID